MGCKKQQPHTGLLRIKYAWVHGSEGEAAPGSVNWYKGNTTSIHLTMMRMGHASYCRQLLLRMNWHLLRSGLLVCSWPRRSIGTQPDLLWVGWGAGPMAWTTGLT